jgi:hypothetical protein
MSAVTRNRPGAGLRGSLGGIHLKIQKLAIGAQKHKRIKTRLDLHGHAYPEHAATGHSVQGAIGLQNYSLELMSTAFNDAGYSGGKRFAASRASRSESFFYVGEQSRAGRLGTLMGNPE